MLKLDTWLYSQIGAGFLFVGCLLIWGCAETDDQSIIEQTLPARAEIFEPGKISSELPEFAISFDPSGEMVFFNRTSADRSVIQLFFSSKINGEWTEPAPMSFSDGTYSDVDPFVTPDGSRLYFSSTRPVEGDSAIDYNTWYLERTATGWSDPVYGGSVINSELSDIFVSVTRDHTIYFSRADDEVRKLYRALWDGEKFTTPTQLEIPVADSVRLGNPLIDPNETHLYFVSHELGGQGGGDIYIADHVGDGKFEKVRNASPIVNSPYADFAPGFGPEGKYLYFTSERPGVLEAVESGRPPGDLYRIRLDVVLSVAE